MNRINRFLSGALLGVTLLGGLLALTPSDASAMFETKLSCSGNICCTFDDQTGQIYACVLVSTS